jgi:hypothetical protein
MSAVGDPLARVPASTLTAGSSDQNEELFVRSKFEGGAVSGSSSGLADYATGDLPLGFRKS